MLRLTGIEFEAGYDRTRGSHHRARIRLYDVNNKPASNWYAFEFQWSTGVVFYFKNESFFDLTVDRFLVNIKEPRYSRQHAFAPVTVSDADTLKIQWNVDYG